MKKILATIILAVGYLSCSAQTSITPEYQTSPNLIPSNSSTWSNTTIASNNGTSGGSTPGYNPSTNTIIFGYTQQTVAYNYVFNQTLQNAGLVIGGYNYSWKINNAGTNTGTLSGKFTLKGLDGSVLQSYLYSYNDRTVGDAENFQLFSGTQWFPRSYASSAISAFSMEWTGRDDRYWAGYYGPRVREPLIQLRYLSDPCSTNPLFSPECSGYAEAYKTQQCTANALYDSSCLGYQVAYHTQQCSINPLYMSDCPGYTEAYFKQQCLQNALYDKACDGYAAAYAAKYLVTATSVQPPTALVNTSEPAKQTIVSPVIDAILSVPSTTSVTSPTSILAKSVPVPATAQPAKQETKAEQQKAASSSTKDERKPGTKPVNMGQKAKEIAKQAAKATSFESQVAQQGALVDLIGYVPGFAGYQAANIPDTKATDMAKLYYKPVVDNNKAHRSMYGSSDKLHQEMVNSQYRLIP